MKEYIDYLENKLTETLDEIENIYNAEGANSRWAQCIRKEFKEKKEKFNPDNSIDNFKAELFKAIEKYGVDHIDIIRDHDESSISGFYHSDKDSFTISHNYAADMMTNTEIKLFSDKLGIGYSI